VTGLSAIRQGQGPVPVPGPVPASGEALVVTLRGEPYGGAAEHLQHDCFPGGVLAGTVDFLPGRAPAGTVGPFRGRVLAETIDFMPGRVLAEIADSCPGRVLAGSAGPARLSATRNAPDTGDAPATRTVLAGTRPAPDIVRARPLAGRGPSAIPSAHPEEGA
jgi:rsbT antagonist protein RsbS